jgi:hypothetical protein
MTPDYLGDADLLALDIEPAAVSWILQRTSLTGHDGRPCVHRDQLPDLLAEYEQEGRR